MEGSPGQPPPPDREISAEISGMVGEGESPGLVGGGEETASTMGDSTSRNWTDEKHRLYLNSIEASFVDQLYTSRSPSYHMLGWPSITERHPSSSGLKVNNQYSSQFKVLRQGFWETLQVGRPRTRHDIENDSRRISDNPWIQHFRSSSTGRRLVQTSSGKQENDDISSEDVHLSLMHGVEDCGEITSSKLLPPCCTLLHRQDSVGSSTEMSDQNFADDDYERESRLNRTCRKKRTRASTSDASGKDQVVPFGRSPVLPCSGEFSLTQKVKEGGCSGMKTCNSNAFLQLESKPSQLKDQELNSED